jgi:hypothetical protein
MDFFERMDLDFFERMDFFEQFCIEDEAWDVRRDEKCTSHHVSYLRL